MDRSARRFDVLPNHPTSLMLITDDYLSLNEVYAGSRKALVAAICATASVASQARSHRGLRRIFDLRDL